MRCSSGVVPDGGPARAAAIHRPSGDQDRVAARTRTSLSFRSGPPRGETRWMVPGTAEPGRGERTNAMRRPSGDQAGPQSTAGSVVTRRSSEAPISFT
jgi:hypothetical protein